MKIEYEYRTTHAIHNIFSHIPPCPICPITEYNEGYQSYGLYGMIGSTAVKNGSDIILFWFWCREIIK